MQNGDDLINQPTAPVAVDEKEYDDSFMAGEIEEIVNEEVIGTTELDDDPGAVYHCTPCGVDFLSVVEHLEEYHRDEPVVVDMVDSTEIGQHGFQLAEYSFEELIEEDETPEFDCEAIKEEVFKDVGDNEITSEIVHAIDQRTCSVCKTVLGSKQGLKIHMRMHKPGKPKPSVIHLDGPGGRIRCAECGKTFAKEQAREHADSHRLKKNYLCELCNRRFASNEVLLMHLQSHTGEPTAETRQRKESSLKRKREDGKFAYPCQYCGKEFYRPYEKVEHERIHTGEKPFSCQICGKSFRVSYCLTLHMRTHLNRRPYSCALCQKSFSSNSVYAHHLLTHSDERKFKCSFCGKSFKTLVLLSGHRKSHTRPFTCSECSRQFATLHALRMHMPLHQREAKLVFACNICGATYGRQSALRDHHREQHNSSNTAVDDEEETDLETYFVHEEENNANRNEG